MSAETTFMLFRNISGIYKAVKTQLELDTVADAMQSAGLTNVWLPGFVEKPPNANWTWISNGIGNFFFCCSSLAKTLRNNFRKLINQLLQNVI